MRSLLTNRPMKEREKDYISVCDKHSRNNAGLLKCSLIRNVCGDVIRSIWIPGSIQRNLISLKTYHLLPLNLSLKVSFVIWILLLKLHKYHSRLLKTSSDFSYIEMESTQLLFAILISLRILTNGHCTPEWRASW